MSKTPYVMAVACRRADRKAAAWRQFRAIVAEFAGKTPDREPPDLPWLAVLCAALRPVAAAQAGDDAGRPRALPRLGADRERIVGHAFSSPLIPDAIEPARAQVDISDRVRDRLMTQL